jgi:hypothetical protein
MILCFYSKDGVTPKLKEIKKFLNDIQKKFNITGEAFKRKLLRLITLI